MVYYIEISGRSDEEEWLRAVSIELKNMEYKKVYKYINK